MKKEFNKGSIVAAKSWKGFHPSDYRQLYRVDKVVPTYSDAPLVGTGHAYICIPLDAPKNCSEYYRENFRDGELETPSPLELIKWKQKNLK